MKKILKVVSLVIVIVSTCILPMACSNGNNNPIDNGNTNESKRYTVTFDSCGGEYVEPGTTSSNGYVLGGDRRIDRDGYKFLGWYVQGTNKKFDFSTPVNSDVTLYAKWAKYLDNECSYSLNDKGTYTITAYNGDLEAIILPYEYQGKAVTAIGTEAFSGCSASFVTIPYSIREIGNSAFVNAKLTMIEIPEVMEKVGNYAFERCYNLKTAYLSGDEIGRAVFTNCVALSSVFIDKNAGRFGMGKEIFNTCLNLKNIYCASATEGSEWDSEWKGKNENANVIWNCEYDGNSIFQNHNYSVLVGYMDFNWVNPSESLMVKYTHHSASLNKEGYEGYYNAYISAIGNSAFRDCNAIRSVELGGVVEYVGAYAFAGCKNLKRVIIRDCVTEISEYAFKDCTNLTEIVCFARSKPEDWSSDWNKGCSAKVVWALS